jgi:hypothetical protein
MRQADRLMYAAKHGGKNAVVASIAKIPVDDDAAARITMPSWIGA